MKVEEMVDEADSKVAGLLDRQYLDTAGRLLI